MLQARLKSQCFLQCFERADEGRLLLDDSLHVRNRFFSAADGSVFRVSQDRDATPELYAAIGRTAKIYALAHAMICGSSNLAANLLLDFVGVEYARTVLRQAQVDGVELRRGVEDHGAHERAINNEATADGLLSLLSAIRGDFLTPESKREVIRILLEQRFNSMIPAGLPAHATVAHKTGEISTACHDIGIIYLPEREPYIAAILTEFDPDKEGRREQSQLFPKLFIGRCCIRSRIQMKTEFLRPIDGWRLAEEYRALLRPGESEAGANGTVHRLPRFFMKLAAGRRRMKFGWRRTSRSRN